MRTRHVIVLSALLPLLAACASPDAGGATAPSPKASTSSIARGPAQRPTVLLAAHEDGQLVRVDLGARTKVTTLIPDREGKRAYPMHVDGARVVYAQTTAGDTGELDVDIGVVDPRTGERRMLSRDGETVQLLHSPDRRHRYVVHSADSGIPTSLFRTDADGGNRMTLIPEATGFVLADAALSPDGRTLYVARTEHKQPSTLLAVDTATGRQRVVDHGTPFAIIGGVVASPDGRLLALTVGNEERPESGPEVHVALLPTDGGETRLLESDADLHATAFSRDGGHVVLTHTTTKRGPDDYSEERSVLALAEVATGRIERIKGTERLMQAVSVD